MQADKNAKREEELQRKKEREALEVSLFSFLPVFFCATQELQCTKRGTREALEVFFILFLSYGGVFFFREAAEQ